MEGQQLERSIGLGGAAATLVGYVVGASIFILPGELAASTGPAIFLSFLLPSIPALLSCFVTAQIGCVYHSLDEITLFKSLGIAVEDLASAQFLYRRALETGAGTRIDF